MPHSFLVDPVVRAAMQIDVSGAVLIFDEAHNIEDTARCEKIQCREVDDALSRDALSTHYELQLTHSILHRNKLHFTVDTQDFPNPNPNP